MATNRLAFGLLALACVTAAGGGAYLATRYSRATPSAVPASADALPLPGATVSVTETETIVDDPPLSPELNALTAERPVAAAGTSRAVRESTGTGPREAASGSRRSSSTSVDTAPEAGREQRASSREPSTSSERPSAGRPAPAPAPIAHADPILAPSVESRPVVPEKTFEDLIVAADSVLGLQIDTSVTSEKAKVEDKVNARVTRDVKVGNDVAIPAGSRVEGSVTLVDRGGKIKERARLGIRFHTLVLADGTIVPLSTETLYREGESPAGESTAKIGGAAVGGAILGAIMGGKKGATIGGAVGAAGGTAAVMAGDRNAATLPAGSTVTVRILSPVTVTVER